MLQASISKKSKTGEHVTIRAGAIIEDDVEIGDGCYIDYQAIIKSHTTIGANSFVGANCILGEYLGDFFPDRKNKKHPLIIGEHSLIRSGTIMYGDTVTGPCFQTGHGATIRERTNIGHHVSIGTRSDINGFCEIGNYVRLHSDVFIGEMTRISDYVWIFPHAVITNDPTPPSCSLQGVHIDEYTCVCANATILPGKHLGKDSLIGAGAVVTKDVEAGVAVAGNPAKAICRVEEIKDLDGNQHYPWRDYFSLGMHWET